LYFEILLLIHGRPLPKSREHELAPLAIILGSIGTMAEAWTKNNIEIKID
jgi:hypothetical protein